MQDETTTRLITRAIWGASLLSSIALIVILTVVATQLDGVSESQWILGAVGAGVAVVAIGAAYALRGAVYKLFWREHAVTATGYLRANVAFIAPLETAVALNAMLLLVNPMLVTHLAAAGVCVMVHAMNFPHGRPMQASEPRPLGPRQ